MGIWVHPVMTLLIMMIMMIRMTLLIMMTMIEMMIKMILLIKMIKLTMLVNMILLLMLINQDDPVDHLCRQRPQQSCAVHDSWRTPSVGCL